MGPPAAHMTQNRDRAGEKKQRVLKLKRICFFSAREICVECVLIYMHSPWGGRVEGWSRRSPGLGVPVAGSCSSRMSLMWKPEGRPEISFPDPSSSRLQHAKSISAITIYCCFLVFDNQIWTVGKNGVSGCWKTGICTRQMFFLYIVIRISLKYSGYNIYDGIFKPSNIVTLKCK